MMTKYACDIVLAAEGGARKDSLGLFDRVHLRLARLLANLEVLQDVVAVCVVCHEQLGELPELLPVSELLALSLALGALVGCELVLFLGDRSTARLNACCRVGDELSVFALRILLAHHEIL